MKKIIYRKWWFGLVVLILVIGGIGSLGDEDEEATVPVAATATAAIEPPVQETATVPIVEPATQPAAASTQTADADQIPLSKDEVLAYTANLTGRTFIKEVEVSADSISVTFYRDFNEYSNANPGSGITNKDYVEYLATGDQINKLLMQETSRLFKQFPGAASVDMTIPFDGQTYAVDLTKGEVENFYHVDFSTLTSNEKWREKISDPYFNKAGRQRFVDQFVVVN